MEMILWTRVDIFTGYIEGVDFWRWIWTGNGYRHMVKSFGIFDAIINSDFELQQCKRYVHKR